MIENATSRVCRTLGPQCTLDWASAIRPDFPAQRKFFRKTNHILINVILLMDFPRIPELMFVFGEISEIIRNQHLSGRDGHWMEEAAQDLCRSSGQSPKPINKMAGDRRAATQWLACRSGHVSHSLQTGAYLTSHLAAFCKKKKDPVVQKEMAATRCTKGYRREVMHSFLRAFMMT